MNNFYTKLAKAHEENNSLLCIGLDPDPKHMPIPDIAEFNRLIIEATSDLVCCYKPNLAFYEALGMQGLKALEKTLEFIPSFIPIIGDAKRGDVASTSRAYADAMFKQWGFDATTVNPYLGRDGIDPFIDYSDKGILVLCRTSNPGASEFQDLQVSYQDGYIPLYEKVALSAKDWNRNGNIGLVVGATYPEELSKIRSICEDMFILAPGVGSQGGDLESTIQLGIKKDGLGIAINVSRSLLYASNNSSGFQAASRAVATELRDRINKARQSLI
jgi:orotidine-5'-phosphate decarboxylase